VRAEWCRYGEDAGWEGVGGGVRCARHVSHMSAGTNMDTARIPYRILAGAPGVVARLDAHMEAEEEVVVVVRAMSGCMKTWGG
jgi:hypothetical protein